jgi:L-lysine 6-transaminase
VPNSRIITDLSKYILTDGFHVVVDIDRSEGSWIVDVETGNKYLDCYSQFASQALGWNHPALVNAQFYLGKVALHKLANSDMYSEEYHDFVTRFSSITPDFSHYFFIEGGALGVENALKAAFDWKAQKLGICSSEAINRMGVAHMYKAFHGRTGYTLSMTNTDTIKTKRFPQFNWTTMFDVDTLGQYINDNTAAIVIEPIQGEGGDNHFSEAVFTELRHLADKHEAMLIFDEVQTGVGLTGKMWAYEHFGVIPDMMCFGKKTQVCGFCSTERIDEVPSNVFNTSGRINSTWGGNIVDMARFRCIIDAIEEEKLVRNAQDVGQDLLWNLRSIDGLDNVRGRGLMVAFDLKDGKDRDALMAEMQHHMIALNCGHKSIRLRPALTFSKEDADLASSIIKKAIVKSGI